MRNLVTNSFIHLFKEARLSKVYLHAHDYFQPPRDSDHPTEDVIRTL